MNSIGSKILWSINYQMITYLVTYQSFENSKKKHTKNFRGILEKEFLIKLSLSLKIAQSEFKKDARFKMITFFC